MSRIGRQPIAIPAGVTVQVSESNLVTVKGPKGELELDVHPNMTVSMDNGKKLDIAIGFSHPVILDAPENVTFETPNQTTMVIKGIDKQVVGSLAADIRAIRPPEPYLGKGIKYQGEHILRKEGKAGKK